MVFKPFVFSICWKSKQQYENELWYVNAESVRCEQSFKPIPKPSSSSFRPVFLNMVENYEATKKHMATILTGAFDVKAYGEKNLWSL